MNELYNHRDANYYKKALPRMIILNKRCRDLMKRKAFNTWKNNVNLVNFNNIQRNLLLKDIIRNKQTNVNNALRRFVNQWNKLSNNLKNDDIQTTLKEELLLLPYITNGTKVIN